MPAKAFGNVEQLKKSKNIKLNYTGKMFDAQNKLYYFHARYYDPVIGRFLSVDPAQDGDNWWSYAKNSPLIYTDPTGLYYIQKLHSGKRGNYYKLSTQNGSYYNSMAIASFGPFSSIITHLVERNRAGFVYDSNHSSGWAVLGKTLLDVFTVGVGGGGLSGRVLSKTGAKLLGRSIRLKDILNANKSAIGFRTMSEKIIDKSIERFLRLTEDIQNKANIPVGKQIGLQVCLLLMSS